MEENMSTFRAWGSPALLADMNIIRANITKKLEKTFLF